MMIISKSNFLFCPNMFFKYIYVFFLINLSRYIPILMAQASIYWDMQNYTAIEKIFRKSVEFCSDHDIWRLNVGHVLFMQDNNKYRDAIGFYEPIVKKHYDNVQQQQKSLTLTSTKSC